MSSEARAGETFLGLDVGTSSIKALLIDVDQRIVADVSTPLSLSRPHPLWSEQNPEDWVEGVEAAVAADPPSRPGGVRASRRDRPFRANARRDVSRRRRRAAAAGDPVERRPRLRRMRRARTPRARFSRARRQYRDAGLHRAQGSLGRRPRAGGLRRDRSRPAAQGFRAPALIRRSGLGHVGRLGHAVARHRASPLGRRASRRQRAQALAYAAPRRGLGGFGRSFARASRAPGASRDDAFRSPAAPATTRPPRSASARSSRARASFRSAPRA